MAFYLLHNYMDFIEISNIKVPTNQHLNNAIDEELQEALLKNQ